MNKELNEELEEFEEDFDVSDAKYEVWFLVYDASDHILGSQFVESYSDPDSAIKHAKGLFELVDLGMQIVTDMEGADHFELVVETVVQVEGEDMTRNVKTLFSETRPFEKK